MAELLLRDVTVEYPIYNAGNMSLRNQLVAIGTGGRIRSDTRRITTVTALDGIDLHLTDGDRVGLVGHNGSGKTTLLRTMAGIFTPTRGTISITGSVSTVFGLGAGLDGELTGYENIVRMSMLLGATRKAAEAIIPDVEDFTELGDFLSVPVRTYSAGMVTRLAFAVATAAHPEILLIDEVLGAGDTSFQEKARRRMSGFIEKASIFVLASHSEQLLADYCHTILRLEHGVMIDRSYSSAPARKVGEEAISAYAVIQCRDIVIAIDPKVVSEAIRASLRDQIYEIDEERELKHLIGSDEVILEIGGGCGLISTYCALRETVRAVFCVEANPLLIPLIAETHRLNQVNVTLYNEILGPKSGTADFYLHEHFWDSSKAPDDGATKVAVRMTSFQSRLNEINPTMLIVDIEGGELDLFETVVMPSSVRKILLEVHQKIIGSAGVGRVFEILSAQNFHYDPSHSHKSIVTFSRVDRA
jgi:FkbM family methyltransferase